MLVCFCVYGGDQACLLRPRPVAFPPFCHSCSPARCTVGVSSAVRMAEVMTEPHTGERTGASRRRAAAGTVSQLAPMTPPVWSGDTAGCSDAPTPAPAPLRSLNEAPCSHVKIRPSRGRRLGHDRQAHVSCEGSECADAARVSCVVTAWRRRGPWLVGVAASGGRRVWKSEGTCTPAQCTHADMLVSGVRFLQGQCHCHLCGLPSPSPTVAGEP